MNGLRYLDVCSGISAPTMAWKPLGWQALCFAEIEAAPRAVLSHHYPGVPLRGDFTEIRGDEYGSVDLLVGGTPCQSFSVAGLRGGIHDSRGNLALEFLRLADRARPRWVVWENVPGVFSALSHDAPDFSPPQIDLDTGDGPEDGEEVVVEDSYDADESHAFACFLAGLSELGYGFAYRVFDAQHAGVPQRRRRVFVVGYLGDWRRAAAVLFERQSLSGHPPPRREAREGIACESEACPTVSSKWAKQSGGSAGAEHYNLTVAHSLRAGGHRGSHANAGVMPAIAFAQNQRDELRTMDVAGALAAEPGMKQQTYVAASAVRRLIPRECERLQGFPDNFTLVPHRGKPMADGPRYKMLGNSMAVPVVRWIGERIAAVEALALDRMEAAA